MVSFGAVTSLTPPRLVAPSPVLTATIAIYSLKIKPHGAHGFFLWWINHHHAILSNMFFSSMATTHKLIAFFDQIKVVNVGALQNFNTLSSKLAFSSNIQQLMLLSRMETSKSNDRTNHEMSLTCCQLMLLILVICHPTCSLPKESSTSYGHQCNSYVSIYWD